MAKSSGSLDRYMASSDVTSRGELQLHVEPSGMELETGRQRSCIMERAIGYTL